MEAQKNNHELNPLGIPDALHMMIHLKLFIPLFMLTTLLISHIQYNNNLKFKKIPFSYAAGKYALDDAHFPLEESLSDAEFMQAHKHWLMLIKISTEPSIYGGWKAHQNRMVDEPDFIKWSSAWCYMIGSYCPHFWTTPS